MSRRTYKSRGKKINIKEGTIIVVGVSAILILVFFLTKTMLTRSISGFAYKNNPTKNAVKIKTPVPKKKLPVVQKKKTTPRPVISTPKKKNIPKSVVTAKSTPKSVTTSYKGQFYIQLGAFKAKSNASILSKQLGSLGYKSAAIVKVDNFYKVRIYGFSSKNSALSELGKLKKKGFKGFVAKK